MGPGTKSAVTVFRAACATLIMSLGSCWAADNQEVQYQFCVKLAEERGAIQATLARVARNHDMKFPDRSVQAERESQLLDREGGTINQGYPLIMMTAGDKAGSHITVTNAGLPANQAVLGISVKGSGASELKNALLKEFSKRWELKAVPQDRGALPLRDCGP